MKYKRIGIIGGVAPAATTLYYHQIIRECKNRTGTHDAPEILIYSLNLEEINSFFIKKEYGPLIVKLVTIIQGMAAMGCDFAALSCNTLHMVFDSVAKQVKIPIINIIEAVKQEMLIQEYSCVGLLGTTFVMQEGIYRDRIKAVDVNCIVPAMDEQEWIMTSILDDLQKPEIPIGTVNRLLDTIKSFKEQGAQAVILGCTDLAVAITRKNSPLPLLDSTEIHVQAIVKEACNTNQEKSMSGI